MKKQFLTISLLLLGAVLLLSLNTKAQSVEPWEFPVMGSDMEVLSAQGEFEQVDRVYMDLTERLGSSKATGLILSFYQPGYEPKREVELEIIQALDMGCGSVQYLAGLKGSLSVQPEIIQPTYFDVHGDMNPTIYEPVESKQFFVTLTDHTERFCDDQKDFSWEATVREGQMGSSGSIMTIVGTPERY